MKIAGRSFRLIGKAETVFVNNHEEKVTLFRPNWIEIDLDPNMPSISTGTTTLHLQNSFYEDQYAAGYWHSKASTTLGLICRSELSLGKDDYTYTKLNGFEFVFLIKNQYKALEFKMIVAEL